jgi:RNA recognition motif-containing protein
VNIYVGNLSYKVEERELQEVFEEYGAVTSAKIIFDRMTNRSKGFGFVEMDNDDEARQAIEALNGTTYKNRQMVVNQARPKR